MSVYQFAPSADIAGGETNFAFWQDGFSLQVIEEIRALGDSLAKNQATIDGNRSDSDVRRSQVGWISQHHQPFLYDRMAFIARQLNGQYFNFDLFGFVEDMQYTVYGPTGEHYNWHMDKGNKEAPRKLSLVLQLSDPDEYEGGELEFQAGATVERAEKQKGRVYAFPSYLLHRVTPVTRGTRRSLVVWVAGPRFR